MASPKARTPRLYLLGEHTVPLNISWVEILGLDTLAQSEADKIKHLLHPGVALD